MYNEGISIAGSVLDVGVDLAIVKKSGAWFYLDEDRLGQGRENAKEFLKHNPRCSRYHPQPHPRLVARVDRPPRI